ncbi:sugar transferase [Nodularia sp. UHCC 0506]|uniref:sugar transferase n=1 Tax=Nodularia sp. UHCC 0506 TaxID=3110243 RepID=UPI002B1F0A6B|nr:sugar transferase [Nodularia sp. UHCC 0506]MEA5515474.1 sugar transferase [Nodularia sp. UHCC 0506]
MNHHLKLATSLDDVELPEKLPPIVLIAFTRPELLKEVLNAISQQTLLPPKIIGFVDGARKSEDEHLIAQCISLLEDFSALVPVQIVARKNNLGCDQNVILGLTEVLTTHDSLVYLEDDTVPNQYFYDRMCRLLEAYRDCKQVCSVSAYANLPAGLDSQVDTDFIMSNRVFCWGFGTWFDRWQEIDLVNQSAQYNPFGSFYQIPATSQTKMTMVNQFWLEKNKQTDWVITFTLAALYHQKLHIIPTTSFTYNIGFGHPQSKTYKGKEASWVNARYQADFRPHSLPSSLELPEQLKLALSDGDLVQYLLKQKGLWLNLSAFMYLLPRSSSLSNMIMLIKLFITSLPLTLKRWRSGLPM